MNLTRSDIKAMWKNGESATDILRAVVEDGREYPDAVWFVSSTLHLDDEERAEMEDHYTDCV